MSVNLSHLDSLFTMKSQSDVTPVSNITPVTVSGTSSNSSNSSSSSSPDLRIILNHIKVSWCNGNEKIYRWMMGWLANAVISTNTHCSNIPVLIGKHMDDDPVLLHIIDRLWHVGSTATVDPATVTDNPNYTLRFIVHHDLNRRFPSNSGMTYHNLTKYTVQDTFIKNVPDSDPVTVSNICHIMIIAHDTHDLPYSGEKSYTLIKSGGNPGNRPQIADVLSKGDPITLELKTYLTTRISKEWINRSKCHLDTVIATNVAESNANSPMTYFNHLSQMKWGIPRRTDIIPLEGLKHLGFRMNSENEGLVAMQDDKLYQDFELWCKSNDQRVSSKDYFEKIFPTHTYEIVDGDSTRLMIILPVTFKYSDETVDGAVMRCMKAFAAYNDGMREEKESKERKKEKKNKKGKKNNKK